MKKFIILNIVLCGLFFLVQKSYADMLVVDPDISDSANNPQILAKSDPATEKSWMQDLLGITFPSNFIWVQYPDLSIGQSIPDGTRSLNYEPVGFDWTYASVKMGNTHYAFQDTDNDDILSFDFSTGTLSLLDERRGLSHITFFGTNNPDPVPEPATMFLFGTGIIGLAGAVRKRGKK